MEQGSNSNSLEAKNSRTALYSELRQADEKLTRALMSPIKATANEAKGIALSAKKDATSWKNIRLYAILGFMVVASGALASYFTLKDKVEDTEESMIEYKADMASVKEDMASVKIDIQEVKIIVEEDRNRKDKKDKKQIEEIKSAITKAIAAQQTRPKRR